MSDDNITEEVKAFHENACIKVRARKAKALILEQNPNMPESAVEALMNMWWKGAQSYAEAIDYQIEFSKEQPGHEMINGMYDHNWNAFEERELAVIAAAFATIFGSNEPAPETTKH